MMRAMLDALTPKMFALSSEGPPEPIIFQMQPLVARVKEVARRRR